MYWQVQECRTKPSIAGRQAAAVVPQRRDRQRKLKIGGISP
jgi:hypothetical protein